MGEKGRPWGLPFWFGGSRGAALACCRWQVVSSGPPQGGPCHVGSRPTPGGSPAFSGESRRKERRGLCPLDPLLLWPARWHSLVLAWWGAAGRWLGYFGAHVRALIWKLSFAKMLSSIFSLENASQIGLSIPEGIAPRTDQRERSPKPASDSKRTIKPGVQGRSPGPLSPHFSGEMGTPAGQAGPPGRCAPRPVSALPTRRVRSTGLPLAGGSVWTIAG